MNYNFFNLDKFEFTDDKYQNSSWWAKVSYWRNQLLFPRTGAGPVPVELKKEYILNGQDPFLEYLFEGIGFKNPLFTQIVSFHDRRLELRYKARRLLYFLFALPSSVIFPSGLFWAYKNISAYITSPVSGDNSSDSAALKLLAIVLLYMTVVLSAFVFIRIANKVTEALTIRRFADSLCALTIVYLVVELSRDDVLINTEKRRSLIARLNDLARNTLFLTWRFSSKSEMEHNWAAKHFRHLERYIRERERWIISPSATTLSDLRRDFYNLVDVYLTGNYGAFEWKYVSSPPEAVTLNKKQRILLILPRYIGIILPLILLAILLWRHEQLESLGIGVNIVALIFIAWFLLAIDAVLKLGIVAGVINLAKEIKNLK